MTKYIAPIAAVVVAALSAFSADIAALIAAHPTFAGIFAALGAIAASLAPQPQK
jgi:hypothetical protein